MVSKTPHPLPIEPLKICAPNGITNTKDALDKDGYDKLTQNLRVIEKHAYKM